VLLRATVRTDRTVHIRLEAPVPSPPEFARLLRDGAANARADLERAYGPGARILVRAQPDDFLVTAAEFAQFVRDYEIRRGGYRIDRPDAAATERGAMAVLSF